MKRLLVALAGVVVALVVVLLAAPVLVPTDAIRSSLADAVRLATGRELKIAGAIRVRVIPTLGVSAEAVSFANAPWASVPEMVTIRSLDLRLGFFALLGGRIQVTRLVLGGAEIDLETGKDGRGNWQFDRPQAAPAAAAGAAPAAPRQVAVFDDIRIEAGRATYRDQRGNTSRTLDHIGLGLSFPGLDRPFAATGAAIWNGEAVNVMLKAAQPGVLLAGGESTIELTLTAAPLNLGFAGTVRGLPPQRTSGTVEITSPSLRRLIVWGGDTVGVPGDVLGPLAVKGTFGADGGAYAFQNATIALDAIRATGDLRLVIGGPRPALSGKLVTGALDLNPYLPEPKQPEVRPGGPPAAPSATTEAPWSDAPLNFAMLHGFDAAFTLAAESILWRTLRIDQPALALKLLDGRLHADLTDLTLYRGRGQAALDLDAAATPPALGLALNLAGADIQALLDAAIGFGRLTGTGMVEFAVTARGGSQRALIATLGGKGALDIADGHLNGFNLLELARTALPGSNTAPPGSGAARAGGTTPFGSLAATFRIESGVLHNDDLHLKSGLVPATGAGTVDLPARTIDYRVVPQFAGAIKIPVHITGPWSNIAYLPDGAEAIRNSLKQPGTLLRGFLPRP